MNGTEVTIVRVYLSEGHAHLDDLLKRLHDVDKVRGVTVFRGIAGWGDSGRLHTSRLVDLSLDLPVVVEFFDAPEKIDDVLDHLRKELKPDHVLSWRARLNDA